MAELKCNDGTVIQISIETEVELRKAFEPEHVWEHGDIFERKNTIDAGIYMYAHNDNGVVSIIRLSSRLTVCKEPNCYLKNTKFLFNIKEKL